MRVSLTENEWQALKLALAATREPTMFYEFTENSSGRYENVVCDVSYYEGAGIAFDCYSMKEC